MKNAYLDEVQIHSNTDNTIGFFISPGISGLEQPDIRLPNFDRPNVDGAIVPNQLYGGRLISFTGIVKANDVATYRVRRMTMDQAVSIKRDIDNNLSPRVFKFLSMNDLALQIEVYTRKFDFPDLYNFHGSYKLDLFAPRPNLLSQIEHSTVIYPFSGGGMAIPVEIPLPFDENAISSTPLTNLGNTNAFPTIIVNGPMTDPTIVNETLGQTMNFDYTLLADEFIVIDTITRAVSFYSDPDAVPVSVRDAVTGDFIVLAPGSNTIKLSLGSYSTDGNVQFNWRDSYSGI